MPIVQPVLTNNITEDGFCNPDTTVTRYGTYNWPETRVGERVLMDCAFGSESGAVFLSRQCVEIDRWMDGVDPGLCFSEVTLDIQRIGVSFYLYHP